MAAPTIREIAALSSTGTSSAVTQNVILPASRQVGDLLLIDISTSFTGGGAQGFSSPGWTQKHIRTNSAAGKAWLWRICDGTEGATAAVTQTAPTSPGNTRWKSRAWAITAGTFNASNPFDSSSGAGVSSATGQTAFLGGSFTPSQADCLAIVGATMDSGSVRTLIFDAPAVEKYDDSTLNHLCAAEAATVSSPTAGVSTQITATYNGTTQFTSLTIVVAPPAAAAHLYGASSLPVTFAASTAGTGTTGSVTRYGATSLTVVFGAATEPVPVDPPGISLAPGSPAIDAAPVWVRIDEDYNVQSWSIDRGRQNEMSRTDTGTATIELVDRTGDFDPTNPVGFFSDGDAMLMSQAAISLQNPVTHEWTILFRGFVASIRWVPYIREDHANVTLDLVDGLAFLAACEMAPDGSFGDGVDKGDIVFLENQDWGTGGAIQTRINKVLTQAKWPLSMRSIFTGNVGLQKTVYAPRTTVLSVIQDTADAEFPDVANVYIGGPRNPGKIIFHGRKARFEPENPDYDIRFWQAGDDTAADADPATVVRISPPLTASLDDTLLFTSAFAMFQDREGTHETAGQYVTDEAAADEKGLRTWSAEGLLTLIGDEDSSGNNRTAAEETRLFADYVRDNYAAARVRVGQLTIKARRPESVNAAATWALMCGVDISDVVHLKTTHGGGGGFDDDFYVEGIHYAARPGGLIPYVELTLDVSPRGYYDENPWLCMQKRHIIHGRDHLPTGADPIPGLGAAGGPAAPSVEDDIQDLIDRGADLGLDSHWWRFREPAWANTETTLDVGRYHVSPSGQADLVNHNYIAGHNEVSGGHPGPTTDSLAALRLWESLSLNNINQWYWSESISDIETGEGKTFSIAGWFKFVETPATGPPYSWDTQTGTVNVFNLDDYDEDHLALNEATGTLTITRGGVSHSTSAGAVSLDTWHFIAYAVGNGRMRLYVDPAAAVPVADDHEPSIGSSFPFPGPLAMETWGLETGNYTAAALATKLTNAGFRSVAVQLNAAPVGAGGHGGYITRLAADVATLQAAGLTVVGWGEVDSTTAADLAATGVTGWMPQIEGPGQYGNVIAALGAGVGSALPKAVVTNYGGLDTPALVSGLASAGITAAMVEVYADDGHPDVNVILAAGASYGFDLAKLAPIVGTYRTEGPGDYIGLDADVAPNYGIYNIPQTTDAAWAEFTALSGTAAELVWTAPLIDEPDPKTGAEATNVFKIGSSQSVGGGLRNGSFSGYMTEVIFVEWMLPGDELHGLYLSGGYSGGTIPPEANIAPGGLKPYQIQSGAEGQILTVVGGVPTWVDP